MYRPPKVGDLFKCIYPAGRTNITVGKVYKLAIFSPEGAGVIDDKGEVTDDWNPACFNDDVIGREYWQKVTKKHRALPEWW